MYPQTKTTATEERHMIYNPSAIATIFNNSLSNEITKKVFHLKGIYQAGKGTVYNGFYYDTLKDEYSDANITLIVPAMIRQTLIHQQTIECTGYLSKRVQVNGARIELQVNLIELTAQNESTLSDEQIKAFEILQKKASKGYRDVDAFIKTKIIQQAPITVTIIVGKTSIIESDIKHQLKETIGFFDFRFVGVNLTSESEILSAFKTFSTATDILVLARGGGENMAIFNRSILAEASLTLRCFFMTAIGHKEDISLLQKVADKALITPTALGQYFNEIYTNTIEELQHSKAKLVDDITRQLNVHYEKQLSNLREKIKDVQELSGKNEKNITALHAKELELYKRQSLSIENKYKQQIQELHAKSTVKKDNPVIYWILVIIAIFIGIAIGKGCN